MACLAERAAPEEAVEIHHRPGPDEGLVVLDLGDAAKIIAHRAATRSVFSSAVPAGMSIETRNVFLFALGSMRNFTHWKAGKSMVITTRRRR